MRFFLYPALTLTVVSLASALAGCRGGGARTARDASGNLLFNPTPLRHPLTRHVPGTPYWCFSEVRGATDETECSGQRDACETLLGYSRQSGLTITGGCREAEGVVCYTRHVDSDQTLCVETQEECLRNSARDGAEIGKPNVSACVALDRNAAP